MTSFWAFVLVSLFLLFVYGISSVLPPFILGLAIAYLCQPLIRFAKNVHMPSWIMPFALTVLLYCVFITGGLFIFPYLKKVSFLLSTHWLYYKDFLWMFIQPFFGFVSDHSKDFLKIQSFLENFISWSLRSIVNHLGNFLDNGLAIARFFVTILVAPLIAFHFMKDGDKILKGCLRLMPLRFQKITHDTLQSVDFALSSYLRGQLLVSLTLAFYYATCFLVLKLHLGALIGVLTGFFAFIPYVGIAAGLICATLSALFEEATWTYLITLWSIFAIGQTLEASVLTPILIGRKTGIHPLWVLFAIFAGGALKGFVGVLLALPFITIIAGIWKVLKKEYFETLFYQKTDLKK